MKTTTRKTTNGSERCPNCHGRGHVRLWCKGLQACNVGCEDCGGSGRVERPAAPTCRPIAFTETNDYDEDVPF